MLLINVAFPTGEGQRKGSHKILLPFSFRRSEKMFLFCYCYCRLVLVSDSGVLIFWNCFFSSGDVKTTLKPC